MTETTPQATRAFVLGLDGVPWYLLDRFLDEGHLPNVRRLREEGVAGPLRSTHPPNTPTAWPSIASGRRADGHGLYDFFRLESDHSQQPYTSDDVRAPTLWDALEPAVVGNVPMTYPAPEIDGTAVSGMMSPELDRQATHPAGLADEIDESIPEYEIGLDWSEYKGRTDEFLDDLEDLVDARRGLLDLLREREDWRLFFFVFTAPDRLQHLVWDEAVILDHYRQLDEIVGDVMAYCEDHDATLYVVSDHGFGPISKTVNVNRVLAKAGLLAEKDDSGTRGVLDEVGVTKKRVMDALERVGITDETIVRTLPDSLVDSVAGRIPGDHARYDVDYANTEAFLHGLGSVYVNDSARFDDGIVSSSRRHEIKDEVTERLETLRDPETGERVLSVYDGHVLYENDEHSPDLIVQAAEGYVTKAGLDDAAFGDPGETSASHRSEGVFFAWGPDVADGIELTNATVYDVAPTLLHGLGEPIPADADGEPLDAVYAGGSHAATEPVATADYGDRESTGEGIEEFDDVEDRLRGLGYVE
jgi:predicted AlkP superfamily phosphohydrolase/phosphomutase